MALKMKKKSLADKINSLITITPTNFGSDEEADGTKAKTVQRDESDNLDNDFEFSTIRNQNVHLLDEDDTRYAGKKISRKDVYKDDSSIDLYTNSENEVSVTHTDSEEIQSIDKNIEDEFWDHKKFTIGDEGDNENLESDEHVQDSDGNTITEDENDYDISNPLFKHWKTDSKFVTISNNNLKADIDKGSSVRCQLKMWENLLELRIKLQKCLITCNQMPQYDVYRDFRTEVEFMKKANETKTKLKVLLDNMLDLQNSLLKQYPETEHLGIQRKKRKFDEIKSGETYKNNLQDEEICSDTEDESEEVVYSEDHSEVCEVIVQRGLKYSDYEKVLAKCHECYTQYRNSVIQKWNEKTKVATGYLNSAMGQTTLNQIEFALSDKQKLKKKTQLKRSEYDIIGKAGAKTEDGRRRVQEYDPEIYDDDDFYHQLLRDLIEYKSSDVTDPIQLSKQWIQLQNLRSKMKRKIDTRATKGRRIRYNVHSKLVNFMAPVVVHDIWTDHAKDELYNSLFGKIKSADAETDH